MNPEQNRAFHLAVNGHHLLILGPAGTGQSQVMSEIYKQMGDKGINVQITCSTGIACTVYPNMNACTVHKYLGLEDGRYNANRINEIHTNCPHYSYAIDTLSRIQCLIVDNCSMLSKETFKSTVAVCTRKTKKSK